MLDGSMNVAVFAGLVAAIAVVAAMSLLGAVALMLSASRRNSAKEAKAQEGPAPPVAHGRTVAQVHAGYATGGSGYVSTPSQDTIAPRRPAPERIPADRRREELQAYAPPGWGHETSSDPQDRPTTPSERSPSAPIRRPTLREPPSPTVRARAPSAEQFFEEEEGEEYGVSTFDPLLRRGAPTPDWAEEEGSTEIFSAHSTPEAEFAFAEFEEIPTRLGTAPPGQR